MDKYIVLDNELEFRNYITSKLDGISKIYVFLDELENNAYFYSFFENGVVVATIEKDICDIEYYFNIYIKMTSNLKLNVIKSDKPKCLKFTI